jgi:hypothetical protein
VSGTSRSRQVIDSITQAAQQAEEQQARPVSPTPAPGKKDRNWEREDDHRTTPLRLQPDDAEWLREFAREQNVTLDSAGRGLVRAIRQAVEQGWVTFGKDQDIESYTDTIGRQRTRIQIELRHRWQIPHS